MASAPLVASAGLVAPSALPAGWIPGPFIGPQPATGSIEVLATLDGVALLKQITLLPEGQLETLALDDGGLIDALLSTPPLAEDVTELWAVTPAIKRAELLENLPRLVGNLEGVPYGVRNLANRAFLASTVAGIRAQLDAGVGRAVDVELESRLHMLGEVERALEPGPSGEARTLVNLDVTGEGRAVVAIGPLQTADYVTFLVPGMYFGVDAQLVDWAATSDALLVEQQSWNKRLGLGQEVATVAWIGYRTPTLVNVASMDLAREGRDALTASLQGLTAGRESDVPYISILAHSYGSTAALLALQENDVTIDALAMVGSPGSPAASVRHLKVRSGNVWVAAADWDPITASGLFGSLPLSDEYGAHHFGVDGVIDPVSGRRLAAVVSHNDYFTPGSTSMRNMALIGMGRGDLVVDADGGFALPVAKMLVSRQGIS